MKIGHRNMKRCPKWNTCVPGCFLFPLHNLKIQLNDDCQDTDSIPCLWFHGIKNAKWLMIVAIIQFIRFLTISHGRNNPSLWNQQLQTYKAQTELCICRDRQQNISRSLRVILWYVHYYTSSCVHSTLLISVYCIMEVDTLSVSVSSPRSSKDSSLSKRHFRGSGYDLVCEEYFLCKHEV